jgi:hypothetical protein
MTPEGAPFTIDSAGHCQPPEESTGNRLGITDLFCSKGMFAAACYLGDSCVLEEARAYLGRVDEAIANGTLENDQIQLDPKNPVAPTPGRIPHGPFMVQIGTASLLASNGYREGVEMGLRMIRYELQHHVNLDNRVTGFAAYDMWEAIDKNGAPYRENGVVASDPGHALEFAGLSLQFLRTLEKTPGSLGSDRSEISRLKRIMPQITLRNFENGYQPGPGGICKLFDLVSRQPINTDMPWWSLPETIRAALLAVEAAETTAERKACLEVFHKCHNDFTQHYILPDRHLTAVQTRNFEGQPVPVVPATPDADPGYHTGLSLIDAFEVLEKGVF